MKPYIPYAWQKKGETQRLFSKKNNNRLNVLGIMSLSGHLTVYHSEQTLDGEFVKNSLNDFCKKEHKKPRVIVMDNGPIHHAKIVKDEFEEWENQEMSIFFLPTYSPHLNPIEILWRFTKYKCGAARAVKQSSLQNLGKAKKGYTQYFPRIWTTIYH